MKMTGVKQVIGSQDGNMKLIRKGDIKRYGN